ncbi:transglutaminase-like domain-containing protein [Caldalkalibacillus mannanilyticus]|uniref:transglutaminase-like domain-containing protein n=1 Tax=Caldalkalibacillus mannanilyticus TaxID=1418 RepID=UPI000469D96D|nr:transglutaminase-like domain-containing protein [Caldalkalibacillus mannanilyticus]
MSYAYKNRQNEPVEIWLALPMESRCQRNIQYHKKSVAISEERSDYANIIAYYRLQPQEKVELEYSFDAYSTELVSMNDKDKKGISKEEPPEKLSEEERRYYLRSTPLSPINQITIDEAKQIVQGESDPILQANLLFNNLLKHYKYKFPPKERGAIQMFTNKSGDCGEFSFLFTSWCRSLGIPCRTLFGAWTAGANHPHAWNEFFIDGVGWIPVDSSMATLNKSIIHKFGSLLRYGTSPKVDYYFGSIEGKRVAFSLDANLLLKPEYMINEVPDKYPLFKYGGHDFAFGFQSQEGTAPNMQPVYLRFEKDPKKKWLEDILGKWNISEPFFSEFARRIKVMSFYLWFLLFPIELSFHFLNYVPSVIESMITHLRGILLLVFCVLSIYRKETNVFVYFLSIMSLFYLLSLIRILVN